MTARTRVTATMAAGATTMAAGATATAATTISEKHHDKFLYSEKNHQISSGKSQPFK
ncbi:hypothetical protein HOC14_02090 [bacterium]|nr:hypothetical protein [bacterium]